MTQDGSSDSFSCLQSGCFSIHSRIQLSPKSSPTFWDLPRPIIGGVPLVARLAGLLVITKHNFQDEVHAIQSREINGQIVATSPNQTSALCSTEFRKRLHYMEQIEDQGGIAPLLL